MQIGTLISMLNKQKKKATEVMINVNGILYPVKRTEVKDKCIVLEVEPSLDAPQIGTEEDTVKEKAVDVISLHFTIKGQELSAIKKAYGEYVKTLTPKIGNPIELNHCFLPRTIAEEKKISTDVVDFLESITLNRTEWFKSFDSLKEDRAKMLEYCKSAGAVAVFIGEIKEGVLEEFKAVKEAGIEYVHIPLEN